MKEWGYPKPRSIIMTEARITPEQQIVLDALVNRGPFPSTWVFETPSKTLRLLKSLVSKGLAGAVGDGDDVQYAVTKDGVNRATPAPKGLRPLGPAPVTIKSYGLNQVVGNHPVYYDFSLTLNIPGVLGGQGVYRASADEAESIGKGFIEMAASVRMHNALLADERSKASK
jgi:hypothetical protein